MKTEIVCFHCKKKRSDLVPGSPCKSNSFMHTYQFGRIYAKKVVPKVVELRLTKKQKKLKAGTHNLRIAKVELINGRIVISAKLIGGAK